jgi:hypothetical protein
VAIIVSRAVGVDTTANQPAAATANRLYVHTTSGSKLYLPEIDDGAAWQPWRSNFSLPIITPTGTALSVTTGAAYADIFGGAGSMLLDFTRFRQARITAWVALQIGSTSATVKAVDITNTQDITGTFTVNSTTASRKTTSWGNLNSATYAGDASFDIEALQGVGADVVKFFSLQLELR